MLYMPDANMDQIYINHYGFDLRTLDPKLPENARSFDEKQFLANPNHKRAAFLQLHLYALRY